MLSTAKISARDSSFNEPGKQAAKAKRPHPGTLWRLRKRADCVQGGTTKGIGHDDPETPANHRPRRKPFLSGAAAARHRRFSEHHRASVRRPREIDPRARRGDEERRADHAGDAEERLG